ncbi:DNA-3-methyladenine glycosylase I [Enterococcus sp. BWR-S5]|uniref:DNA-3-methyladenine glycosylase I n=1 Tax=Enterococcus sp. BWR-S5 TaxID=2787714 RepID=UPI00192456BE|nr:DNA-3-methyladenine glycosylase I [Enterococcus sp. BWR-S5]MBL1225766.1 DNA-3-methyladenine glycosylase I [Enterococcus sp. BWR-S5]
MERTRCEWANSNELDQIYHDEEWGVPVHDDRKLFEFLTLESMQAGLSWSTILKKRETLTEAYDQFDYQVIAAYTDEKKAELLQNPGVIRNRLKVAAAVTNANRFMAIQQEFGSFDAYIWSFVDGKPIVNQWSTMAEVPASTELSDKISKDLKKRGFKFLGTTTVYAFMQAMGLVDDHLPHCFRRTAQK